jgi:hypothetical protein
VNRTEVLLLVRAERSIDRFGRSEYLRSLLQKCEYVFQSNLNERALPYRSYRAHAFQYNANEIPNNISLFVTRSGRGNAQHRPQSGKLRNNVVADTHRREANFAQAQSESAEFRRVIEKSPMQSIGSIYGHR